MEKVERAMNFAIRAHYGQTRKMDKDLPFVFHPIVVGTILKNAGFGEDVITAGLLHDIAEDTAYTCSDIDRIFGASVGSLVLTATEPNREAPWAERKKMQVTNAKFLPVNNKAVICADKIANLEDLRIEQRINGAVDFSKYHGGREEQSNFYYDMYQALSFGNNDPRLTTLLDRYWSAYYDVFKGLTISDPSFFDTKYEAMNSKAKGHIEQLTKLREIIKENDKPYIIEFCGSDRPRQDIISVIESFFNENSFRVNVATPIKGRGRYNEEYVKSTKSLSEVEKHLLIASSLKDDLMHDMVGDQSIVMCNGGIFELLVHMKLLKDAGKISSRDFRIFFSEYGKDLNELLNYVVVCYNKPFSIDGNRSPLLYSDESMDNYSDATNQCLSLINGSQVVDISKIKPNEATMLLGNSLLPIMSHDYVLRFKQFVEDHKNEI